MFTELIYSVTALKKFSSCSSFLKHNYAYFQVKINTFENYDFFYFTMKQVKHNSRSVPFVIAELGHKMS